MRLNRRDFLKAIGVVVGGFVAWTRGGYRTQDELLFANEATNNSGIVGTVTNIVTDQAIVGALVSVAGYPAARTNEAGAFSLPLPPGLYEVHVKAPGFIDMSRVHQEVSTSSFLTSNFAMVPANPSEEDNKIIYEKLVVTSPGLDQEQLPTPEELQRLGILGVTIPSTINVQINGQIVNMPLEDYVKGVVPAEMPSSWPMEALKAQAVVARSYAIVYAQANGYICTTTSCQAYTSNRYASTNSAVDATRGQVVTYNGNIVSTHFFSSCGGNGTRNSENAIYWSTCAPAGWSYVAYERGKACWGIHNPGTVGPCGYYGHGVGMCQWGARDRATEGWDYLRILTYYYTSISVYGVQALPAPPTPLSPANGQFFVPSSTSITLSWSAVTGAIGYWAEGQKVGGGWSSQFGWTSSTSWPVGVLPAGLYQWRVKAQNSSGGGNFSDYSYFVLADHKYSTYFPRADKNSTGGW